MSYQLFKTQLAANLFPQHQDQTKPAIQLAQAYNGLVLRHFETLSAGGQFLTGTAKVPAMITTLQSVFTMNRASGFSRVNIFSQLAPAFLTYWAGNVAIGPAGIVTITSPGVFQGPPIPETTSMTAFLDIFCGVISTHILSLVGTYTNIYTGITVPWSGALLITTP